MPLSQVDQVLGNRIWPDDVTCRLWKSKPPERDDRDARPSRDHYEEESAHDARAGHVRQRAREDDARHPPHSDHSRQRNKDDYWWNNERRDYGGQYDDSYNYNY